MSGPYLLLINVCIYVYLYLVFLFFCVLPHFYTSLSPTPSRNTTSSTCCTGDALYNNAGISSHYGDQPRMASTQLPRPSISTRLSTTPPPTYNTTTNNVTTFQQHVLPTTRLPTTTRPSNSTYYQPHDDHQRHVLPTTRRTNTTITNNDTAFQQHGLPTTRPRQRPQQQQHLQHFPTRLSNMQDQDHRFSTTITHRNKGYTPLRTPHYD